MNELSADEDPVHKMKAEGSEVTLEMKVITRSLAITTLAARVIYIVVFSYQNQDALNMTVFHGGPSLSYWHLLLVSKQNHRFWNTKSKLFFNMTIF